MISRGFWPSETDVCIFGALCSLKQRLFVGQTDRQINWGGQRIPVYVWAISSFATMTSFFKILIAYRRSVLFSLHKMTFPNVPFPRTFKNSKCSREITLCWCFSWESVTLSRLPERSSFICWAPASATVCSPPPTCSLPWGSAIGTLDTSITSWPSYSWRKLSETFRIELSQSFRSSAVFALNVRSMIVVHYKEEDSENNQSSLPEVLLSWRCSPLVVQAPAADIMFGFWESAC